MGGMTKPQFLQTEHAKRFASIANSTDFNLAVDVAFLAYMEELGVAKDAQDAAARNWRREGAAKFLSILKNIATPEVERQTEKWPEMVKVV